MLGSTRIIDLTVSDIERLIALTVRKEITSALQDKASDDIRNKSFSFSELANLNIVGRYHKIKSLIRTGKLEQNSDGRINGVSIYNYLQNKKF